MRTSADACRVLSLDGGGAKGFYTLGVLKEIEAMVGQSICERFDLIFGTSTGGRDLPLGHIGSVDTEDALTLGVPLISTETSLDRPQTGNGQHRPCRDFRSYPAGLCSSHASAREAWDYCHLFGSAVAMADNSLAETAVIPVPRRNKSPNEFLKILIECDT